MLIQASGRSQALLAGVLGVAAALLAGAGRAGQAGPGPAKQAVTQLGVRGTAFTLGGAPTFLLGVSYYGGLGAPDETVDRDLASIKKYRFNWVRVWATWSAFGADVSAVD